MSPAVQSSVVPTAVVAKDLQSLVKQTTLLTPSLTIFDDLDADALAFGVTTDIRPLQGALGFLDWRLCGRISQLMLRGAFVGNPGECALTTSTGRIRADRIFLFGWGPKNAIEADAPKRFAEMVAVLEKAKAGRVAVGLPLMTAKLAQMVDRHVGKTLSPNCVGVFADDIDA